MANPKLLNVHERNQKKLQSKIFRMTLDKASSDKFSPHDVRNGKINFGAFVGINYRPNTEYATMGSSRGRNVAP